MMHQIGLWHLVRPQFVTTGVLNNVSDRGFGAILDGWPIFAFAHDLGTVSIRKTAPVVYTIGYVRDPLVQFSNVPNVNSVRSPYYLTRYGSTFEMVRSLIISFTAVRM